MSEEARPVNGQKPSLNQAVKTIGLNIVNFSVHMSIYLWMLYLLLALIEVSSNIPWGVGSIFSITLYSVLWILLTFLIVGIFKDEVIAKMKGGKIDEEQEAADSPQKITALLVAAIGTFVAFSQVSRHLYLLFGGFNADHQTSYWLWLRFGIDQFLDHVLFGIRSIFNWRISEIQPTDALPRALVLVFNIELDALVIASVLRQFGLAQRSWRSAGTIQQKNYVAFVFSHIGRVLLFCLWVFPLVIGVEAIVRDQLTITPVWGWIPLVLGGAALAWYSLRALRLLGIWNRLNALVGIIVGILLIWVFFYFTYVK